MRLKPGDEAIPFSVEIVEDKTISLEGFAGNRPCPMCNLRLQDFAQHYSMLHERRFEVVAFFDIAQPIIYGCVETSSESRTSSRNPGSSLLNGP